MQSQGVQANAKHSSDNEQETQQEVTTGLGNVTIPAVSSKIDDRTMYELYLWPFVDAVSAGTASVMCSYNRFNGTCACENDAILNKLLKDEHVFQGYVSPVDPVKLLSIETC